jgi:hypothetical protein
MIALPKHKMTADEFLAWAERLPKEAGRFELWDGDVIVKHGPVGQQNAERSQQHWDVKGAAYRALHDAIKRAGLPALPRSMVPASVSPTTGSSSRMCSSTAARRCRATHSRCRIP